jgi:hypothetical protein
VSNETVGKIPDEDPRERLLDLVRELGHVSEACRRLGVDRSVYYRSRRRGQRGDARARSPLAKPPDLEKRLIALCLEYPEWGCDRLAYYLTLKGSPLSSPTAQKILMRHNLGRKAERLAAVRALKEGLPANNSKASPEEGF